MDLDLDDDKMINLSDEPLEDILQGIIDRESGIGEEDEPHQVLIILDDAINYIATDKRALNIFKKLVMNGRHILGRNSSVMLWIVSQKVKSIPLVIRSQANQVFFFNSTKAEKEVVRDEFLPLDKNEADQLYKYVFDEPFNFLFINLFLPQNKRLFRNFNQLLIKDFN